MQLINPTVGSPVVLPQDNTILEALNAGQSAGIGNINASAYKASVEAAVAAQKAAPLKAQAEAAISALASPERIAVINNPELTDPAIRDRILEELRAPIAAYYRALGVADADNIAQVFVNTISDRSMFLSPNERLRYIQMFGFDTPEALQEPVTLAPAPAPTPAPVLKQPQISKQSPALKQPPASSQPPTSSQPPAPSQQEVMLPKLVENFLAYNKGNKAFAGVNDAETAAKIINALPEGDPLKISAMEFFKKSIEVGYNPDELDWIYNNANENQLTAYFGVVDHNDPVSTLEKIKIFWRDNPVLYQRYLGNLPQETVPANPWQRVANTAPAPAPVVEPAPKQDNSYITENQTNAFGGGGGKDALGEWQEQLTKPPEVVPPEPWQRVASTEPAHVPAVEQTPKQAPLDPWQRVANAEPAPKEVPPFVVKVQRGDTLSGIVKNYLQANNIKLPPSIPFETYVGMVALASGIKNPNQIKVDDIIKFPPVPQQKEQPTPKPYGLNVSRSDLITSDAGTFLGISPADWAKASGVNEKYFLSNASKAADASTKADFAREKGNTDAAAALDAKATQAAANVIVQPHTKAAADAFYRKVLKMTSAQLYAAGYTDLGDKKLELEKLELEKGKQATEEKKALQDIEESKARAAYYYATAAAAGSGGGNVTSLKQQYTSVKSLADIEARFLTTRQVGKATVNYLSVLAQQDAQPVSQDIANSYAKYLYYTTGEVVPFKEVHNLLGRPKGFVIDKDKRGKLSQDEQFQLLSKLGLVVNGVPIPSLPAITSLLPGVGDGSGASSQSTQDSSTNALLNEIFGVNQ